MGTLGHADARPWLIEPQRPVFASGERAQKMTTFRPDMATAFHVCQAPTHNKRQALSPEKRWTDDAAPDLDDEQYTEVTSIR